MKNRYISYGYVIRDGQYVAEAAEAKAVGEVFRLYAEGQSYQSIAGIMNKSSHPAYSPGGWNKHHIKRMLENRRYMGDDKYPAILEPERFKAAQAVRDDKTSGREYNENPAKELWKRIVCGECGQRLLRLCVRSQGQETIWMECENPNCNSRITIRKHALYTAICSLMTQAVARAHESPQTYTPSPEAIKLEREINRALMKPDDPANVVRLILQGINARYGSIPAPPDLPRQLNNDDDNDLREPDWDLFRKAVSHISLSPTGAGLKTISGQEYYMGSDEYADGCAASKGSDGDTRQSQPE